LTYHERNSVLDTVASDCYWSRNSVEKRCIHVLSSDNEVNPSSPVSRSKVCESRSVGELADGFSKLTTSSNLRLASNSTVTSCLTAGATTLCARN
jgi:hypothetical protein